uniref:Conserved oligomeric Golgi complex subunit 1 n=3 Tax=Schistocephalus solidus TaxID=70667 RepID=A0A0X3PPA8_SCHSO
MMDASVEEIFRQNPVDEIRRFCAQIRNEVENKKIELRFLVGERHRDIIEASDSILFMKESSTEINRLLDLLENACRPLSSTALPSSKMSRLDGAKMNQKKAIAAQLKLLLDVPELTWSALDDSDFATAMLFFLLGRHLSVKLQLSGEMLSANVHAKVLLKRQWAALDHVETTIITACRSQLSVPFADEESVCGALSALIILEDQTMEQSLGEFLSGRTSAVNKLLGCESPPPSGVSRSGEVTVGHIQLPVRRRLSLVAELLLKTLDLVGRLYARCAENAGGQIGIQLKNLVSWRLRDTPSFASDNLFEYIPENVASFQIDSVGSVLRKSVTQTPLEPAVVKDLADCTPEHRGIQASPLDQQELAARVSEWWQQTLTVCHRQLSDYLRYAGDLESLINTRAVTLRIFSSPPADNVSAPSSEALRAVALGRSVDLWSELYQPIFMAHLETLLEKQLGEIFDDWRESVVSVAKLLDASEQCNPADKQSESLSLEVDLSRFVWCPSASSATPSLVSGLIVDARKPSVMATLPQPPLASRDLSEAMGVTFFACLTGREDLLPPPPPAAPSTNPNENSRHVPPETTTTTTTSGSLPTHLVWRLQRLLESALSFKSRDLHGRRTESCSSATCVKQELNQRLHLYTPEIIKICERFDQRLCDTIGLAVSGAKRDEELVWKLILDVAQRLLHRFEEFSQGVLTSSENALSGSSSDSVTMQTKSRGTFFIARALLAVLDACPGLGAAIVSATCRLEAANAELTTGAPGKSYTVLADIPRLRQTWLDASQRLRSIAAQLSFTAVVLATSNGAELGADELTPTFAQRLLSALLPEGTHADNGVLGGPEDSQRLLEGFGPDVSLLGICSTWSEIVMKPDEQDIRSKSGDALTDVVEGAVAVLRTPSRPTWLLHESLLSLARRLTSLTVHLFPRCELGESFSLLLAKAHLDAYASVCDSLDAVKPQSAGVTDIGSPQPSALTQPRALQLIFDVRFLLRLLVWPLLGSSAAGGGGRGARSPQVIQRASEVSTQGQHLLTRLEQAVDPFDLEMGISRMNSDITRAVSAVSGLYSILVPQSSLAMDVGAGAIGTTAKAEEDTPFLMLLPNSLPLDSAQVPAELPDDETGGRSKASVNFALLPFSISSVCPSPARFAMVQPHQPPLAATGGIEVTRKTSATAASSVMDSWFGHLSFS